MYSHVGFMAKIHNMHGMHIVVDCGGCPLDLCMLHNGPKCRIYYIMSDGSVEFSFFTIGGEGFSSSVQCSRKHPLFVVL